MTALALATALASGLGTPISTADAPRVASSLNLFFSQGAAAASQVPPVLWGFFWCDCVYEGGPVLQSLHRSKRSALRAMIRAQTARWESSRDNGIPSLCGRPRREFEYRPARRMEGYSVRAVEVLP